MKNYIEKYTLETLIIIAFLSISFICCTSSNSQNSKENDSHNNIINIAGINDSLDTSKRLDSLPESFNTFYVLDSFNVFKSSNDNWSKTKVNSNIEQYISNDSIQIGKDKAILINIKNETPYFTKDSFSYTRIEVIDSSENNSAHNLYERNDLKWQLKRRAVYNLSNPQIFKTLIEYDYQDSHISERKSVYSKSIANPIHTSSIEKHIDGGITYDTTYYTIFDADGNLSQQIRQGLDQNGKNVVFTKIVFQHNDIGLKTKVIVYDDSADGLKKVSSTEFEYDDNNRLVRKIDVATDDNPRNYTVTYKYDIYGNCTEQYYVRKDNGYPFVRKSFTYNEKNQIVGYVHENKMKISDQYRSIDARIFEYDNNVGNITKITKNGKIEMNIEMDNFGNIIEGLSSFANRLTRTIIAIDYSIPHSNIKIFPHSKLPTNSYKFAKVDEYGLKYYNNISDYSHAISSRTTFKINGSEEELYKKSEYKYRSL